MKITIECDLFNWNEYIARERANKYWANKIKQQEKDIARYSCIGKKYEGKYPVTIIVTKHFKDKRQDLDNVRIKGILDGLISCGVIKGDNLNCIRRIIFNSIIDGKNIIEIEVVEYDGKND